MSSKQLFAIDFLHFQILNEFCNTGPILICIFYIEMVEQGYTENICIGYIMFDEIEYFGSSCQELFPSKKC